MLEPISVSFLEKETTINNANHCELIRQGEKNVKNLCKGLHSIIVTLYQDNARPHTAAKLVKTIN